MITRVTLIVLILAAFGCSTVTSYEPDAVVQSKRQLEISGLVASPTGLGYWALDDSGNAASIYRFDEEGVLLGSCTLAGVENVDWEAMTITDAGEICVLDCGDNAHARGTYSYYLVDEEACRNSPAVTPTKHSFKYPDREAQDCEACFFMGGKAYLITKERPPTNKPTIYCIDDIHSDEPITLRKVTDSNIRGYVTDACYSEDRNQLAVLTYSGVYFFDVQTEADLSLPYARFVNFILGQSEALCFDDDEIVITNEPGSVWKRLLDDFLSSDAFIPERPFINVEQFKELSVDGVLDDWTNVDSSPLISDDEAPAGSLQVAWNEESLFIGASVDSLTNLGDPPSAKIYVMYTDDVEGRWSNSRTTFIRFLRDQENLTSERLLGQRLPVLEEDAEVIPLDQSSATACYSMNGDALTVELEVNLRSLGLTPPQLTGTAKLCVFVVIGKQSWYWGESSRNYPLERPFSWGVVTYE